MAPGSYAAGVSFRSVAVAALACLSVAACAGGPSTKTINNPIPVPTQSQLTGTTLEMALLPVSDFPAGYEVDTQETSNSGSALLSGSSASAPATRNCQQLGESAQSPTTGLTAAVREVLYDTAIANSSSAHQSRYGQDVFQFATVAGSAGFFDSVRSAFTRCPSVTTVEGAAKAVLRQTIRTASVAGQPALLVRQTGTVSGVAADSVDLYTLAGTDVYLVGETVFSVPLTAQPASLAAQMAKLIARVHATECALACP